MNDDAASKASKLRGFGNLRVDMEDAIFSSRLNSVESNQSTGVPPDVLSPEDVAWADSCLNNDLEISKNGWNSWSSLKDAMNEVTNAKCDPSPSRLEDFSLSSREIGASEVLDARVDDILMLDEGADKHDGDQFINENSDLSSSRFDLKNVFRPAYSEFLSDWRSNDYEELEVLDLGSEHSVEDIFKVWNLDIPSEEDEFTKQLNKTFSESSLELKPPDDSKLLKGLDNESLDDIICGMADLSLTHSFTVK